MVPRTSRPGRGFKGAWSYYSHDKRTPEQKEQAEAVRTRERVGFVHTENLGGIEDDRAAIGLMIDTAKRSTRCKAPVYAFSLGWHPEETPDQTHMIDSGREALKVLGMQDYQALMIAHTDTAHPHLHIIVNRIHPETGKAINLYKDQEKLSAWALGYEREQGKVYCQAREFKALARQAAKEQDGRPPPRRYVDNTLAECWTRSDSGRSFKTALEAKGWGLAKGDRKENVLMAVAPSGRAFAVLRELNKGLPKGQTIKGEAFDRQTADLKREDLRPVKEVQQEMERRARSRSGEKSRQPPRPRRAEPNQEQRQGQARTPDEGKAWALEMRIRAERRALDERQAQARERQQAAANARLEKARQEAMQVQQVRRQEQALREVQERLKQGGWFYRVSGKAKQDQKEEVIRQELLEQSRARVNGWMERERGNMAWEFQKLAQRQEAERATLEKKIEEAQKIGTWREGGPARTAQQRQAEPGEQQEHGRGGRTRER
jgi:uncharacterized membrane protein YkoI